MDQQQTASLLKKPFATIALSLSGGGFRAAAFSLGTMAYLHRVGLLDRVQFISSASGGSFTNAAYLLAKKDGLKFSDFYSVTREKMSGVKVLNRALAILDSNDKKIWPEGGKKRNIINAFALAYDELFFEKAAFEDINLFNGCAFCFNTTDFYRGMSFRFQSDNGGTTNTFLGGNNIRFDKSVPAYKKLKVADMIAASSCFPAGFEPIEFPRDFVYEGDGGERKLTLEELNKAMILQDYDQSTTLLNGTVGFMDGGITDNQGIYSCMTADRRRQQPFDLIMAVDVASYFMEPYKTVEEESPRGWRGKTIFNYLAKIKNTGKVLCYSWMISVLFILLSAAAIAFSTNAGLVHFSFFVLGPMVVAAVATSLILGFAKGNPIASLLLGKDDPAEIFGGMVSSLGVVKTFSAEIINKLALFLGSAKLATIEQMLKARAASVISLSVDVNLKQTRRLIYDLWYEDTRFDNRRCYCVVYELASSNASNRKYRLEKISPWLKSDSDKRLLLDDCEKLSKIADDAFSMATTFWFDNKDQQDGKLDNIIAAGQFTTCFNLLQYVMKLQAAMAEGLALDEGEDKKLADLRIVLERDWGAFKEQPLMAYDKEL